MTLVDLWERTDEHATMWSDIKRGLSHPAILTALLCLFLADPCGAAFIWMEGEAPAVNKMNRHPWWYDQVRKGEFSGGDFISNFKDQAGEAEYKFSAPADGSYEFWVRANPLSAKLSYALNGAPETSIDLNREKVGEINVAADSKPDLRFLAWSRVGKVSLRKGENLVRFRMSSDNNNHGYLDCFVFANESFTPRGILKPGQVAEKSRTSSEERGWFAFDPERDKFGADCPIDLRALNESTAGAGGFIAVKDGEFIHTNTGEAIRFWAVNGPSHDLKGAALRDCARMLAKRGVNMVRVHGGYFRQDGSVDEAKVLHACEIVEAMKAEGIYTHFSIYFPLWLQPKADAAWLAGYDGNKHPFAALFFNEDFQAQYRKWWTALLTAKCPGSGTRLVDEPAVAALEMQNEDSLFFWTFAEQNVPDPQLRLFEGMFGKWLSAKYGSLQNALEKWKGVSVKRDAPGEGRIGFRPLWAMFNEKTVRDQDTAAFLLEVQTRFYTSTHQFLRQLGFKGPITASNWSTASPEVFGPLEKLSYMAGDFIDRHGYFSCNHKGDSAEWSIRAGHTYTDRSALRFDAESAGKPKVFVHPGMDPHYGDKPSMISETTWNRPNRFRGEAPLYLAAYGALQHSDAIVHFALDGDSWQVKPGYWMQPWTLMSPTMMGQFPAAALIFRLGLVKSGQILARVNLNTNDLLALKGTPLPQDAALDELRLKDVPQSGTLQAGQRIDPLIHFAGRAQVNFTSDSSSVQLTDLRPLINHETKRVKSSTGEVELDYGKGVLLVNAAAAQGVSGSLAAAGQVRTTDMTITSDLETGHIIAVALDRKPLSSSTKILLQVMSEEKPSGFTVEDAVAGTKKITNTGTDPWLVREFKGEVRFLRPDASNLQVKALDLNGYVVEKFGSAAAIKLGPTTVYYLIGN